MIDWATVAYIAAILLAYLAGRYTRGYMSWKMGVKEGVEVATDKTMEMVCNALQRMGHGELISRLKDEIDPDEILREEGCQ